MKYIILIAFMSLAGCQEVKHEHIKQVEYIKPDSLMIGIEIGVLASHVAVEHGSHCVRAAYSKYKSNEYFYHHKMADSLSLVCDSLFALSERFMK